MVDQDLTLSIETRDRTLKKILEKIIFSSEGFSLLKEPYDQKFDLLIYELSNDVAYDFQDLRYRLETDSIGDVFLVSNDTDRSVLLQAIKLGVKEFFTLPLKEEEFKTALGRYKENFAALCSKEPKKRGQIIDVVGSKGGIGTTTVAVNVAANLALKPEVNSVALFDMNVLFGEVPIFLDLKPQSHWVEIAKNIHRVDSTFLMNILAKHKSGLHVLSSPGYLNGRLQDSSKIMDYLLNILRKNFDFVIIDGGLSYTDTSIRGLKMANKILMVSILNIPCLSNTNKLLESLRDLEPHLEERIQIVINRYIKNSAITLKQAEESLDKKIYWSIPNDYHVTLSAINNGTPLYKYAPKAKVTKSLLDLADKMVSQEDQTKKKRQKFLNLF
jgi:pilus assembly protein CpaE